MKNFKLLKTFEHPCFIIHPGVIKTEEEWKDMFESLSSEDLLIKKDWFEEVEYSNHCYDERYPMCKDQLSQIDCRVETCLYCRKGYCINVSPAITLNTNKSFVCWSYKNRE